MLSLKDNPPAQFPEDPLDQFQGLWWVAHTKPRQEKALAWDVFRRQIPFFLPMCEVSRQSKSRAWKTKLVLFPGYVFVCGDAEQRLKTLKTGRIANLIEVVDQDRLKKELAGVKRLIETQLAINPYPALKEGTRCRVRSGPLVGLEGRVERRKKPARFVVEISILGQGAAVEIDADLLEVI